VIVAATFSTIAFAGATYLSYRDLSRLLFIYFYAFDLIFLVAWRVVLRLAMRVWKVGWAHGGGRVLIVGVGPLGKRVEEMLLGHRWAGIRVAGFVDDDPGASAGSRRAPILGALDDAARVAREHEIDDIIIALPLRAHSRLIKVVSELQRLPVRVHVVPDLFDLAFFRTTIGEFGGIPMIGLREPAIEGLPRLVKRLFDTFVGTIALVLALPAMAVIALAIKLDSPGPAIFKQRRVGENGKLFWMLKFRSMYQDAEERQQTVIQQTDDGQIIHKRHDDPRVTRVGRFIRAMSLDELPQLINVLKGDMSLVGPRPELPWLVEKYEPWQRKRFAVPQGITGWWQVHGRSDKPMHLHTEEDLYYIQNYSLLLDVRILWRTLAAVLKRKGAY
jgi:exopolysaccharide biosynthesis polyprenyl glycosylphosphotransferase